MYSVYRFQTGSQSKKAEARESRSCEGRLRRVNDVFDSRWIRLLATGPLYRTTPYQGKMKILFAACLCLLWAADAWIPRTISRSSLSAKKSSSAFVLSAATSDVVPSEADVVIIGSGLAGLSCGALLSHCNKNVVVLESHDAPGGCAHTWERRGFHFESGPSLYSGFSTDRSPNPLKNVFQIIGEDCEWITYDRWGTVLPNGEKFAAKIGPEEFGDVLKKHGGPNAESEFAALMERMKPLSDSAQALTSMALREDPAVLLTLLKYPKELVATFSQGAQLTQPFKTIMDELDIKDEFVRNWLDMLCFLLQGLPATGTLNTVMAYMLADWYRPGVTLDFPRGGSGAIVDALVRGVRKKAGSRLCLNSHVDEIMVEDGKAVGVRLASGQVVHAKEAVVSNADPYITNRLLTHARAAGKLSEPVEQFMDQIVSTDSSRGGLADLKSFIHLHAGIDASGLPDEASADFPAQWAVIKDWALPEGVEAPRNIVLCSMPSLIDPSLAPEGNHVLHAYTPATEPCTCPQQPRSTLLDKSSFLKLSFLLQMNGGKVWIGRPRNTKRRRKRRLTSCGMRLRSMSLMLERGLFREPFRLGPH